jgi:parallel beta-helix repeat protein
MRRNTTPVLGLAIFVMLALPSVTQARTINVTPGHSIQAAVDQAHRGDTVLVAPGTYTEEGTPCPSEPGHTCAVVITEDRIRLMGRPAAGRPVVLQDAGGQHEGIAVGKTDDPACLDDPSLRIDESWISGFTVKGFDDDGVFLFCVDNWRVTNVAAIDNLEYGIFPSHVGAGRLDHSVASGANDTGFYVGQSHDARMDHNYATDNVSGFEIENSTRVKADHNEATGNTGGILSFALPFLDVKSNSANVIRKNNVHDNNRPNTCLDPDDAVCGVPVGTGILLLAADDNIVEANDVTGNDSYGIAVSNFCVGTSTPPEVCALLDIQPDADGNHITGNTVTGNGSDPDPDLPPVFAVDLAWDTTGTGNCWSNNVFGTSFPDPLPACP